MFIEKNNLRIFGKKTPQFFVVFMFFLTTGYAISIISGR